MKAVFTLAEFIYQLVMRLPDFHAYVSEVFEVIPDQPGWKDWVLVFCTWLNASEEREQARIGKMLERE